MKEEYQLERSLWTDTDFDVMSWHDCPIYAISFSKTHELLLDIDYIFKWALMKNKRYFKFWISPCTIVFKNVYGIDLGSDQTELIIDNISRENPQTPRNGAYEDVEFEYDWLIDTTVGQISFKSTGFRQYVRKTPVLLHNQALTMEMREGISFGLNNIDA